MSSAIRNITKAIAALSKKDTKKLVKSLGKQQKVIKKARKTSLKNQTARKTSDAMKASQDAGYKITRSGNTQKGNIRQIKSNIQKGTHSKLRPIHESRPTKWQSYWAGRGPKGMRNKPLPESWGRNPRPKTARQLLDDPIEASIRGDKKMWGSLARGGQVYNNRGMSVPGMRYGR